MSGLRTKRVLHDYAAGHRAIFLRPSPLTRFSRWLRRITFGLIK